MVAAETWGPRLEMLSLRVNELCANIYIPDGRERGGESRTISSSLTHLYPCDNPPPAFSRDSDPRVVSPYRVHAGDSII